MTVGFQLSGMKTKEGSEGYDSCDGSDSFAMHIRSKTILATAKAHPGPLLHIIRENNCQNCH
ncbi:hypothetical protein GCM10011499_37710 [Pelagibacterium lentulum]|uniref:Uncharacterized protein n=1 Tax=Pelagibacterium lentulum TaxID=2029865 RepID=A0A916RQZ4_9HYPH|nr:hypothetical protein GCM10011499_37710 [Pelagibacterium lentulum]